MTLPPIVSRDEWVLARKRILAKEKELTRQRDALSADRRRLPMVEIDKEYVFEGPTGSATLLDLFEGRRQLIVDHYMFDPDWDEGCASCAGRVEHIGNLADLHARDTTMRWSPARRSKRSSRSRRARGGPSLVLVVRQRLQLRLPRHPGRASRADRIQLPDQGGVGTDGHSARLRSSPSSSTARAASCATATVSFTPIRPMAAGPSRWEARIITST